MRIAFVTTEYVTETNFNEGGLANYLHRVGLALIKMGHHPLVIVASNKNETFSHDGIEVHCVNIRGTRWLKYLDYLTLRLISKWVHLIGLGWKLRRKLKEVHARNPISVVQYTHLGGLGFFRLKNIPSVVRLSSYLPLWRLHGEYDFERRLYLYQQEVLEKYALLKADGIFGPGAEVAKVVSQELARPVEVIETPFVMETSERDETVYEDCLKGKTYFLFYGRLSPAKGIWVIADVLQDLLAKNPNLFFVFLGQERMERYSGRLMMDRVWSLAGPHRGRVLYLGRLDHQYLYPVLAHAHTVVLPSRVDNFPNTCLEAMAHQRVIIGSRKTSFEQLLVEGESGLFCEPGDSRSLLQAMERALAMTEEERREMGEKAWRRLENFSSEKVVRPLLDYYQTIISKRG